MNCSNDVSSVTNFSQNQIWKTLALRDVDRPGFTLKGKSENWTEDRDIVRSAIKKRPLDIRYSKIAQTDKELAFLAVSINGLARVFLSPTLKSDPNLQIKAKTSLPSYLPEELTYLSNCYDGIFYPEGKPCSELEDFDDCYDLMTRVQMDNSNSSKFLRDSQVVLKNNVRLLPYPIQNPDLLGLMKALLPASAHHFLINPLTQNLYKKSIYGTGFKECNIEQAMVNAFDYYLPFMRGKTCIEGGNCFFFNSKGQSKAIVGEMSVLLSLIALEEQHYFAINVAILDDITRSISTPSTDTLCMMRNLSLYNEKQKSAKKKNLQNKDVKNSFGTLSSPAEIVDIITFKESSFLEKEVEKKECRKLVEPVKTKDAKLFWNDARLLEAKLALTKAEMSKELGIPLENLIIIPQRNFRIDMEMFVTPEGIVVLHDDEQAEFFLENIKSKVKLSKEEEKLFNTYKKVAHDNAKIFKPIKKQIAEILNLHKIDFQYIPGIFEDLEGGTLLNYCNGLFLRNGRKANVELKGTNNISHENEFILCRERLGGYTFVTTGPSTEAEKIFHDKFTELFKKTFSTIKLHTLPGMSKFMAQNNGGIHCLTFESTHIFETTESKIKKSEEAINHPTE
jgi:hypothetical protein